MTAESLSVQDADAGGAGSRTFFDAGNSGVLAQHKIEGMALEKRPRCGTLIPESLAGEVSQWRRTECPGCQHSAMFYCSFCCTPLGVPDGVNVPPVKLPWRRCDVIFDDSPKKATSVHAKVLAPAQVRLVDLFTNDASSNRTLSRHGAGYEEAHPATAVIREIPEYDPSSTAVLFPDEGSVPITELEVPSGLELTIVVIDAPWRRAQVLRRHPRLLPLRSVRLREPPPSRFWRYHAEGSGCVSTVEALAALRREVSSGDGGDTPQDAWEDPLLFFFVRQFAHIASQRRGDPDLPTDEAAKDRRSARVRQKDRAKRLRPLGEAPLDEAG